LSGRDGSVGPGVLRYGWWVGFVRVAEEVYVTTSRKMSTTSTLFASNGRGLLIDPAWLPDELETIADELEERGIRVTSGFSTHPHYDHLLWHPRFGDAPRWASVDGASEARERVAELLTDLGPGYSDEVVTLFGAVEPLPDDDLPAPFGADGMAERIEVISHNGHAPGHAALWSQDRGVLVVGDMLSDLELPLPFGSDALGAYLAGLDALAPFVTQASVLIPGHGTPSFEPIERLDADRRYLDHVMSGRDYLDARLATPGMRQAHAALLRLISEGGSAAPR
jgi:glyoxylase-like metal-dependent hydrolase (beta-lactamase superfamily II)